MGRKIVSKATRQEMEGMLGQVPSWMENLAEPASEHSWGLFHDLNLGEDTELSGWERALTGVGVAAAANCLYCIYLHTEETRLSGVTDEEFREAVNLAADTKYLSTVFYRNETDLDGFKAETDEIVEYITK